MEESQTDIRGDRETGPCIKMSWPIHKRLKRIAILAKRQAELDEKTNEDIQHISDMDEDTRTNLSDIEKDKAKARRLSEQIEKIRHPRTQRRREPRESTMEDTHDYSHRDEIALQERDLKDAQENYKVVKNEYHRERRKASPNVELIRELKEKMENALTVQEEAETLLQEMRDELDP